MEKSLFLRVFGDYPQIKVLDFLMENDIFDYSKTQIAKLSGVSFNTLETLWDNLLGESIIRETRRVGNSRMYQLNKENPIVKMLLEIDKKLMLESIKEIENEKMKVMA
ncbi:MAG: hypothetical protein U9Q22_06010 [Candidatus Altiarchaeota archaeon]|nr:hypothetical protein [Candidatus Altiarchaeota archaeon]